MSTSKRRNPVSSCQKWIGERSEPRHELVVPVVASFGSMVDSDGLTRNVSQKGVYVVSRQVIPVGAKIDLHFELPATDEPVKARGEVRWNRDRDPNSKRPMGCFGVRFTDLPPASRRALAEYLDSRSA